MTAPRQLIEFPGSQILYHAATGLERSMADADCERLLEIDAELIIDTWDPYATFYRNLPYLAWAMGVLIWEQGWHEDTQREWTARQWEWKAIRGTQEGIRMALEFAGRDFVQRPWDYKGYRLVQALTPPQGFFASREFTKEEHDAWIRLMPEIRITVGQRFGEAYPEDFIAQTELGATPSMGFSDYSFVPIDDGPILHGRQAFLHYRGEVYDLRPVQKITVHIEGVATDIELVGLNGSMPLGFACGDYTGEDDKFVGTTEVEARLIALNLDTNYWHDSSLLSLTTVFPDSFEIQDPRYERNSEIGTAGPFFFSDDGIASASRGGPTPGSAPDLDNSFTERDYGGTMLADRIYLIDPAIASPMTEGFSFVGERVGMPPYHAELLIDLRTMEGPDAWIVDDTMLGEGFSVPDDWSHIDRALRAVVAAKALRDKIDVSFEVMRPLWATDYVTEQTHAGDFVPATL